jgi:hypothetical protein
MAAFLAFLVSLWLPILAAAVAVFFVSFITHMLLPYHRSDVRKLPGDKEDVVLEALRRIDVAPGDYAVPHAGGPSGMREPAFIAKATKGPLAFITLAPGSAPSMGPYLGVWFVYCLVVSGITAYVAWRVFGPATSFPRMFRFTSVLTFLSYGMALPQMSIWYRRSWATTAKSLFDSVLYGLTTGAVFGYLWPR